MKQCTFSVKLVLSVLVASVMVFLTGCIKQKILIKVKPDGSGNIVVSTMFNKDIVTAVEKQMEEQKKQMAAQGMNMSNMPERDMFFDEKQIKRAASKYGDEVEYVRAKKINNASGRGYIAVYSFANIDNLKLDLKEVSSPMPQMGMRNTDEANAVTFKLTKGEVAKLKIKIPQKGKDATVETASEKEEEIKPTPLTEREKAQMMGPQGSMFGLTGKETTKEEVMRKMFGGMSVDIDVEPVGTVVKSNATFQDPKKKNRFTIFAIDFGTLLESDKMCSKMVKDKPGNNFFEEIIDTKKNVKGIKIEEKPEVTVEFKAK